MLRERERDAERERERESFSHCLSGAEQCERLNVFVPLYNLPEAY